MIVTPAPAPATPGLSFLKMHGLGNDFVVIDARARPVVMTPALVRALADRHRGPGFDQLVLILPDPGAAARLVFLNRDGSEAGACGNATRCVGRLLMAETGADRVLLATAHGRLVAEDAGSGLTRVNMGPPVLDWQGVPLAGPADLLHLPIPGDPVAVGMGNPHCVFFVPDAGTVDVAARGAEVEHHPLFPAATNVEFASLTGPDRLRMRVWERGTGITLACGSGTCATAVAAHLRGLTGRRVTVEVDGGSLGIDWREDGVWMTGPTALAYEGRLAPEFLAAVAGAEAGAGTAAAGTAADSAAGAA